MNSNFFKEPQRQSVKGVLLIFSSTVYKIFRGFWVLGIYFFLQSPEKQMILFAGLGIAVVSLLVLVYSYFYYRKFIFYIDYSKEEFKLQKGIFSTEDIAIPFDKIQQVYLKRNILQRIINVYSLVIETAGSSEKEINIQAISKPKADALSDLLIKARKEAVEAEEVPGEPGTTEEKEILWTHRLSFTDLFKIGISSNYLRGLTLILVFFSTLYNELKPFAEDYSEGLDERLQEIPSLLGSAGIILAVVIVVLLLSMLITVLEVFIKYFNLKLQQSRSSLELEMGLKTNTRVSIQPKRIQLLQVTTNPVQKWLDLHEARFSLASSENSLEKSKIKVPGLGEKTVEKIKSFLYADSPSENSFLQMFKPHKIVLFRQIFGGVILPVVLSLLFPVFTDFIGYETWAIFAAIYLVLGILYQVKLFLSKKLLISEEMLQLKSGVWTKQEETVESFKLQSLSVHQPFWYKKRNIINLKFHTAGGDLAFRAVDKSILPYLNYVLYKIESSKKGWM